MAEVRAVVITGHGTNCEHESAYALEQAGADHVAVIYFSDLRAGRIDLRCFNLLVFPGGFLDGDDLGAAQAAAIRWRLAKNVQGRGLIEDLRAFFEADGLILGICNGFQLLVKLGLLPALDGRYFERSVSLGHNASARYEDRWVRLGVNAKSPCVFTKGLSELAMPVRHGEGRIVPMNEEALKKLCRAELGALRYLDEQGRPTEKYPYNPNGSPLGLAGLTDPSGRILGLMPHPEAFNHRTNHPTWTRQEPSTMGTAIFKAGVDYLHGK